MFTTSKLPYTQYRVLRFTIHKNLGRINTPYVAVMLNVDEIHILRLSSIHLGSEFRLGGEVELLNKGISFLGADVVKLRF